MYNNNGWPQSEKENRYAPDRHEHTDSAPGSNVMHEQTGYSDVSHSQTVGVRGPVLVQDTALHETLETFVFSTTLPRRIHTKG